MGLCFVAMGAAALGFLPPPQAPFCKRASTFWPWPGRFCVGLLKPRAARRIGAHDAEILARLAHDHRSTLSLVERVRDVADSLDDDGPVEPVRETVDLVGHGPAPA